MHPGDCMVFLLRKQHAFENCESGAHLLYRLDRGGEESTTTCSGTTKATIIGIGSKHRLMRNASTTCIDVNAYITVRSPHPDGLRVNVSFSHMFEFP